MVGELHCSGLYFCCVCVDGSTQMVLPISQASAVWAVWISGTYATTRPGETASGWPLRLGSGHPYFRAQAQV